MKKGYNMAAGRTPEQIAKMKKLTELGACIFCPEYFAEFHDNPALFETEHWLVTKNDYPYEHTSLHLLVAAKTHVSDMSELDAKARADFMETVVTISKVYDLPSYAVGIRVGDFHFNGGSVEHLHAHVIVGTRNDKTFEPVKMKLTSLPK